MKALSLIVAAVLFSFAEDAASGASFKVSTVSWVGDALHIEVQTDAPDGTNLNVAISNEKTGDHIVSFGVEHAVVTSGRFVVKGFGRDANNKPFRPGHYWLSVADDDHPLAFVAVPITIPSHKQTAKTLSAQTSGGSPELFHKLHVGMTEKQVHAVLHRAPESCTPNGNGTVTCFFTGGENADASIDTVVCVFLVVNDKLVAAGDLNTDESIGDRDLLK